MQQIDYQVILQTLSSKLEVTLEMVSIDKAVVFDAPELSFKILMDEGQAKDPMLNQAKKTVYLNVHQFVAQQDKLINRLKVMAGIAKKIYARDTVLARVDKKVALDFQEEHHLQIPLPGKYRYGLFHQGELVSLAVFSGGRKMLDKPSDYRSFELLRFCHKADFLVLGGISKLLKGFIADFKPGDIMTYSDKDWSQDSSLAVIGFRKIAEKPPQQFWVSGSRQVPIHDFAELEQIRSDYPEGYLFSNSGSIKLVYTV
ncbi:MULTISPECIES: hypothetical protein [unclassified Sphingobacterium]|uniref:hypothetical protein n=1 Tax=unclassified Sphingobacterium TaxID=2609468 RepID=UPI000C0BCCC5|nr:MULTISPECIES: hypothetical protein [unclassified Sphingobacterium]QBR10773.1 hypothetical protein E3D81_00715 [Sphingobacterium sp. CZ-2]